MSKVQVPPRFGACLSAGGEERCALSPASCSTGYRPAFSTTKHCQDEDVLVGRCDNGRCAPSASGCGASVSFYSLQDAQCTMVLDRLDDRTGVESTTAFKSTQFPACQDGAGNRRCVMDGMYCEDDETVDPFPDEPCYCQDVKVGLCYQKGLTEMDDDNSFCAVGAFDCPEETHRFLEAPQVKSRTCRLCHGTGIFPVGACIDLEKWNNVPTLADVGDLDLVQKCAFESTECDPETSRFYSSDQLFQETALYCPATQVKSLLGTCSLTNNPFCTKKDDCPSDHTYTVKESCTLHGDTATPNVRTAFGHCVSNTDISSYRCVWDQTECDETTEHWADAMAHGTTCTCDKVFTGVCEKREGGTSTHHCAVSALACEDFDEFTPQKNMPQLWKQSCPLCNPLDNTSTTTSAPVMTTTPFPTQPATTRAPSTPKPTPFPSQKPATSVNNAEQDIFVPSDSDGLGNAAIFWIVIAAIVGAVSLLAVLGYGYYWTKRRKATQESSRAMDVMEGDASVDPSTIPEIQ